MSLSFVNSRIVEDASFHECVRYQRWEQNRVVSFIPPDGVFQLMKYRCVHTTTHNTRARARQVAL